MLTSVCYLERVKLKGWCGTGPCALLVYNLLISSVELLDTHIQPENGMGALHWLGLLMSGVKLCLRTTKESKKEHVLGI